MPAAQRPSCHRLYGMNRKTPSRLGMTFVLWLLMTAQAPAGETLLTVTGEGGKTLQLTAADLDKLPRRTIQATDRNQEAVSYEGVPLVEVLKLAGAPLGEALKHGDAPTSYVLVEAKDGYRAVFALAELDPAFTDREILLVNRKGGNALSAEEGPLRI